MTATWSPLLVIRPDGKEAILEDSQTASSIRLSPADLARQIVGPSPLPGGQAVSGPRDLEPKLNDWVANGWRPSLEYFDWSEDSHGAADESAVDDRGHQETTSALSKRALPRWNWARDVRPRSDNEVTVGSVLVNRRTVRSYQTDPLPSAELGRILDDFTALVRHASESRTSLAGLRFAAIVYSVEDIDPGVWDLDLAEQLAVQRSSGVSRQDLADLMCGMQAPMTASATIVLIVDFPHRQKVFPYERGLRELYIEVGRLAQKFILAAESHGNGALITPATNDNVLSRMLELPEHEAPVYTITFGRKPAPRAGATGG